MASTKTTYRTTRASTNEEVTFKDPTSDRATIARLRREKDELTRHLHIYEDHIRRLTVENTRLAAELEALAGVTRLNVFRTHRDD
ncbi:hypothetical protein [Streptomyces bobili]|uniref:Uncharacterized protein n=1 Tax=Streptomyces bobili TaxID=67280 RepID=A0ABZ1R4G7_9ACTN|nr:hypothetical protein [Streptomyces bobili]